MQNSTINMFFQLYKKDLRLILLEISFIAGAVAFLGFINFHQPLVIIGSFLTVLVMAGALPIFSSFKLVGGEWSNRTIYLIRALPVSGFTVLGSKLLALVSQFLISATIIFTVGALILFFAPAIDLRSYGLADFDLSIVVWLFLFGLSFLIYFICVSFLSQMIGKQVSKFSGWLTAGAFIAILYLSEKTTNLFPEAVYNIRLEATSMEAINYYLTIGTGINLTIAGVLFVAAVLIYNYKTEI